jgi:hypothetical protein
MKRKANDTWRMSSSYIEFVNSSTIVFSLEKKNQEPEICPPFTWSNCVAHYHNH